MSIITLHGGGRILLTATRYHLSGSRLAGNLALTASKSSGRDSGLDAMFEYDNIINQWVGRMKLVTQKSHRNGLTYRFRIRNSAYFFAPNETALGLPPTWVW